MLNLLNGTTMKGKKILITGGAGFIGSTLAEKLVSLGADVTVLDAMIIPYGGNLYNLKKIRKQIKFVRGDIRSEHLVKELVGSQDFVFHLAAQTGRNISMQNPKLDTDINIHGTLNILNSMRNLKNKPKFIFAGSRGVIGKPEYLPVDENHTPNPKDIYGINKLAAEKYALLLAEENNFKATSLRLNNVYGPKCQIKSNHYGTLNLFVSYALQGKTLPIYGDGKQVRDYVYIDDIVDAFVKATSPKSDGKIYFVGTNKGTSLNEIVSIIRKNIPKVRVKHVPFPKELKSVDFPSFYSTSEKMYKDLGWSPKINITEGISRTIEYYKENLKHYL